MARNGSGVYSLPPGSTAVDGETADAADINTPFNDLESDANVARPVVAGGTGATSASAARTNLGLAIGTDVQAYDATLAGIATGGGVTDAELAADAVTTAKIADDAVATAKIADAAVTTAKVADDAVTTAKIADDAVTLAKIADAAIVTEGEGIASNDNDTTLPTSAAVVDYIATNAAAITRGTEVTTTGGTEIDFTSIPAGVDEIKILIDGLSLSGSANVLVQIGDSGGFETSSYTSGSQNTGAGSSATDGFLIQLGSSSQSIYGTLTLDRSTGNKWIASGDMFKSTTTNVSSCAGSKTLSGELDRIRITTTNGTDTIDANGGVNYIAR